MKLIKNGATAEIVFTVQREDCAQFAAADDIDPDYGKLLRKAAKAGVRITVWPTKITAAEVCLEPERKIDFPG
jgi:sugar fermentation stimulation protein A